MQHAMPFSSKTKYLPPADQNKNEGTATPPSDDLVIKQEKCKTWKNSQTVTVKLTVIGTSIQHCFIY